MALYVFVFVFLLVFCLLLCLAMLWCLDWFPLRQSSSRGGVKHSRLPRLLKRYFPSRRWIIRTLLPLA
jgi:hypothetical protein